MNNITNLCNIIYNEIMLYNVIICYIEPLLKEQRHIAVAKDRDSIYLILYIIYDVDNRKNAINNFTNFCNAINNITNL